ncbi:MAG: hypothetical protein EZS28_037262 [Streblomastix strix]|uniref:Coenzyme PQQ synthesis protein F-like C-terminal lobe domain-containing protein n=1 Tax=Streblomastix strix TaxID=222440 RepID=A0A5J4UBB3_9EUKA|nr:MAG: hypothetical protein EZS28_037262 [Streblomastix strix]
MRQNAAIILLEKTLENSLFERLRTQEQLGYNVQVYYSTDKVGSACFNVLVQSASHDPIYLHNRIDSHLEDLIMNELPQMSLNEFTQLRQSNFNELRESPTDLSSDSYTFIRGFQNRTYAFIASEATACAIETMEFTEFLMRVQALWKGKRYLDEVLIPQFRKNNSQNNIKQTSDFEGKQKEKDFETDSLKVMKSNSIIEQSQYNVDDPRTFPFGSRAYFRVFAPRFAHLKDKPPQEMNIVENQQEEINNKQNLQKEKNQEEQMNNNENNGLISSIDKKVNGAQNKRPSCPPSPLPYFFVKDVVLFKEANVKQGYTSYW